MSNMSYCRFQNTLSDLEDCKGALEEALSGEAPESADDLVEPLSTDELDAAARLVEVCADIVTLTAEHLAVREEAMLDEVADALERTAVLHFLVQVNRTLRERAQARREARAERLEEERRA